MDEAIIKLAAKKGDLTDLKNWRPISLLNVDYKILARVIYNKIIKFLTTRANKNQKAIFPGRHMMEVLLNTQCALQLSQEERKSNVAIVKVDLEKAFDNISHKFMFKMLERMKLPRRIIQWIKILYSNPTSRIMVNGAFTETIKIKRGITQG